MEGGRGGGRREEGGREGGWRRGGREEGRGREREERKCRIHSTYVVRHSACGIYRAGGPWAM